MALTQDTNTQQPEPMSWPSYVPPRETWAGPFWEALSEGKLLLQRCDQCRAASYPPVDRCCTDCGSEKSWVEAAGQAFLWSWTTFHREYYPGYPLAPPYTVMLVELPEGIRMLATLTGDTEPSGLQCDMALMFSPLELSPGVFIPAFRSA